MSTRSIRTHTPVAGPGFGTGRKRVRPTDHPSANTTTATRPTTYRTAKREDRKRDSIFIPIISILAVAGAVTVMIITTYTFIEPVLHMLDGN